MYRGQTELLYTYWNNNFSADLISLFIFIKCFKFISTLTDGIEEIKTA